MGDPRRTSSSGGSADGDLGAASGGSGAGRALRPLRRSIVVDDLLTGFAPEVTQRLLTGWPLGSRAGEHAGAGIADVPVLRLGRLRARRLVFELETPPISP